MSNTLIIIKKTFGKYNIQNLIPNYSSINSNNNNNKKSSNNNNNNSSNSISIKD